MTQQTVHCPLCNTATQIPKNQNALTPNSQQAHLSADVAARLQAMIDKLEKARSTASKEVR